MKKNLVVFAVLAFGFIFCSAGISLAEQNTAVPVITSIANNTRAVVVHPQAVKKPHLPTVCDGTLTCERFKLRGKNTKVDILLVSPDKRGKLTKYLPEMKQIGYELANREEYLMFVSTYAEIINVDIANVVSSSTYPNKEIWGDDEEWTSWCRFLFVKNKD